ncbi:MAG: sigma-70 family RNA polymerase sigma factor [Clostridia bacterium]|nr:sigma-70 family RNA polymerase sigma factor [Clostridia bacterium]
MRLNNRVLRDEPLPIAQAANGDQEAFAYIMQRLTPLIHAQVRSCRVSGTEDEDLAQEALVGLLAAIRSYRSDGSASFTTYATTCIRHRLLSVARCSDSRPWREQPLEEQEEIADVTGDPALRMQEQEEAAALLTRLRERLTPLEYKVMLLRLSDCSYEEIATRLAVSKKAVDNAVQRLRRKLIHL